MNILVFIENIKDKYSLELLSFAKKIKESDSEIYVYMWDIPDNYSHMGKFDINKLYISKEYYYDNINTLESIVIKNNISKIITPQTSKGNYISSLLSGKLKIPIIKNVIGIDNNIFKQKVFSNKNNCYTRINSNKIIIGIIKNYFEINYSKEKSFETEYIEEKSDLLKIEKIENLTIKGIMLSDAKIVVSGGRGMQEKKNWKLLETLAKKLNAGLSCTKPITDIGWRPHNEHVGQTGKTISPDLYIAFGISGSIQHTAGILNSKKIVAINKDENAPIFKIADYGIIGDIKEIIPNIIKEL